MKKSNTQTKENKQKLFKKVQTNKQNQSNNAERAKFSEMNQIDWYPIDPYCD